MSKPVDSSTQRHQQHGSQQHLTGQQSKCPSAGLLMLLLFGQGVLC